MIRHQISQPDGRSDIWCVGHLWQFLDNPGVYELLTHLPDSPSVLEISCGLGNDLAYLCGGHTGLIQGCQQATCIDIASHSVLLTHTLQPTIKVLFSSITEVISLGSMYDFIFNIWALYSLNPPDLIAAMRNMYHLLAPGGVVALVGNTGICACVYVYVSG